MEQNFLIVLMVAIATACAALGGICVVQSITGRPVLKPEQSQRTADQIRRDSRWAAAEYLSLVAAIAALLMGSGVLFRVGIVVAVTCFVILVLGRRGRTRAAQPPAG